MPHTQEAQDKLDNMALALVVDNILAALAEVMALEACKPVEVDSMAQEQEDSMAQEQVDSMAQEHLEVLVAQVVDNTQVQVLCKLVQVLLVRSRFVLHHHRCRC